jgi:ribonuclease VapC
MIIDTSAMVAILYREPEAEAFVLRIHDADDCRISVATYVELSMVIERQLGPEGMRQAETFFRRAAVKVEPVTVEQGELAR